MDRYSDGARRVVALAGSESEALGHHHIGTEHLLLGILADGQSPAAATLVAAGATLAGARPKVAEAVGGRRPETVAGDLPLTARAKRVLERATRFSLQRRSPEIETEHILLAILNVDGTAGQVLRGLGVELNALQEAVTELELVVPTKAPARTKPGAAAQKPRPAAADSKAASSTRPPRSSQPAKRQPEPGPAIAADPPPEPRCPDCGTPLTGALLTRAMPTHDESGSPGAVVVVYCGRCGSALGALGALGTRGT
jgi:ATP-dependent Clp protease ATP-binding subunit ClpA